MATHTSGGAPRVLVVDDEAMLADLLSQALRHEGWETATATDGLDALAKAASFHPDVVILDVHAGHAAARVGRHHCLLVCRSVSPRLCHTCVTARESRGRLCGVRFLLA